MNVFKIGAISCTCGMFIGAMTKDIYVLLFNGLLLIALVLWNKE